MKGNLIMVYHGTDLVEVINVHPIDELSETHCISLVKSADNAKFYVNCCCDEDWVYEFYMLNNSDYERIKFSIMEAIFECDTMDELMERLSDIFEDGFEDIMVNEEHCCGECCGECECE